MPDKHPYVAAPGNVVKVLTHFRDSFPSKVNADTLKKLGFAPNNESYVLNVLRFLGLIDDYGLRTSEAVQAFSLHDDGQFSSKFGEIVNAAYIELFDLHGDNSWELGEDSLVAFFRSTDHTSAIVGRRQASTFKVLAAFAGHGELPAPRAASRKAAAPAKQNTTPRRVQPTPSPLEDPSPLKTPVPIGPGEPQVGLTVRIEINLPADGDQDTYDRIFRSIRENLINASAS